MWISTHQELEELQKVDVERLPVGVVLIKRRAGEVRGKRCKVREVERSRESSTPLSLRGNGATRWTQSPRAALSATQSQQLR